MKQEINSKITKILAEEIKDSRGNPTLKVTVWVGNISDSFSVPSGASTGAHEAHELRDEDGKGVNTAIEKVNNEIQLALIDMDVLNQKEIDRVLVELDGTPNKDNLGGNSMIGVSIACAKVAAKVSGVETYEHLRTLAEMKPSRKIPYLYMNMLEGGKHTDDLLAFQEYLIVVDVLDVREGVDIATKILSSLKKIAEKDLGGEPLVLGDEGGYAPKTSDIKKPLEYLSEAIKENNLTGKVRLAMDVAASSFFYDGKYKVNGKDPEGKQASYGAGITKEELMNIYGSLIKEFDLISIEDPFDEEDFEGFAELTKQNKKLLTIGDDLTVTNKTLLREAIDRKSISGMIIKPNQIGTLSEMLETMQLAREHDIELIVSHRGEETNDDFIADLAYAFGCFGLKAGSPLKPERMVKYQRLINISLGHSTGETKM